MQICSKTSMIWILRDYTITSISGGQSFRTKLKLPTIVWDQS